MGVEVHYVALVVLTLLIFTDQTATGRGPTDPTHNFVELTLNAFNFHIQKPYDLPITERYSFVDGVHKLWVYSSDKPLSKNSPTKPRTEIVISVNILYLQSLNLYI